MSPTPNRKRIVGNDLARLRSYTIEADGCWAWLGSKTKDGRPVIWFRGRLRMASIVAHTLYIGDVPDGIEVCHRCDNPECTNPEHLFLGTRRENIDDAMSKGRIKKGERHGMAILTDTDVLAIRRLGRRGESSGPLAALFGVSEETIRKIKNGRAWKHLIKEQTNEEE